MKKLGKILTLVLSLALVVTALVVIGAANDTGTVSEKNWVVEGVTGDDGLGGFDSFASAITAANGKKITLNKDIEITSDLAISADATIDLGGHTITETRTENKDACAFSVSGNNTSFTLQGEGSIVNCSRWIYLGASYTGIIVNLNGTGDGISVTMNNSTKENGFNLITLMNRCSTMTVTGKVTVKPYAHAAQNANSYIFALGDSSTAVGTQTTELVFDGATFTVETPTDDSGKTDSYAAMWLAVLRNGAKVTVKNDSFINIKHGNAFIVSATGNNKAMTWNSDYESSDFGKITTVTDAFSPETIEKAAWIDIDDSTVHAYNSGWSTLVNYSGAGRLFQVGSSNVLVTADNSELGGANRTINADDGYTTTAGTGNVRANCFLFNNVDYIEDAQKIYGTPWVISGGVNMKWNGGYIEHTSKLTGDAFAYSEIAYTEGDTQKTAWFGVQFSNVYSSIAQNQPDRHNEYRPHAYGYTGTKYENVTIFRNDDVITAKMAFLDQEPSPLNVVADKTSSFKDATNYVYNFGSNAGNNDNTQKFQGTLVEVGSDKRYGGYAEVNDGNNGYLKFFVDSTNTAVGSENTNNYNGIKYWGNDQKVQSYPIGDYKYFVHEFDISTDTGKYTTGDVSVFARYYAPTYKTTIDNKDYYYYEEGANVLTMVTGNVSPFKLENNALTLNSAKYTGKTNESTLLQLPTDGSWARITLVYEINRTSSTATFNNADGTTTSVDAWDYSSTKLHVYRDGEWIGTMTNVLGGTKVPKADVNGNSFALDSLRFNFQNIVGSSTCIDNNRLSAYTETTATAALTAISNNASSVNLSNYTSDFLIMPTSAKLTLPAATVNWVDANGNSLGTTSVEAGEAIAPTDEIITNAGGSRQEQLNGWYDLGLGWKDDSGNVVDLTSLKAETGKTYTFTATTAPIAPEKGVSGIKINLSLRLDFDLNFYVPVPDSKLNVSNVMISKGTTELDSGTIDQSGIGNTYVYGQEVTVYGDLYTKHRDSYGVAELGTRTYTLSYMVGDVVITQDITYGVSNYVAQYMQMSSASITEDQVPRELIMRMVNYVVKVVEHEDNKITKTDEINTIIENYEKLLKKYPVTATSSDYFTMNEGVLARIKVSRASVMGTTDNGDKTYTINTTATSSDLAYYVEGANLYFSTGTPKFIFKYTDNALNLGIKAPDANGYTGWGQTGLWAYTSYEGNGIQGYHLALDTNGNRVTDKWGDSTVKDGSVKYYVSMIDTNFRGKTYAVYDILKSLRIDLSYRNSNTASDKTTWDVSGKYCIEWYINGLVTSNADNADIDLAIALYDYACVAYEFVNGSAYSCDSYINQADSLKENSAS